MQSKDPMHYDPIRDENIELTKDTLFYLVNAVKESKEGEDPTLFTIRALSNKECLKQLASCPTTRKTHGWEIPHENIFNEKIRSLVFPDNLLTTEILTLAEVKEHFGYPVKTPSIKFNKEFGQELNNTWATNNFPFLTQQGAAVQVGASSNQTRTGSSLRQLAIEFFQTYVGL